MKQTDNKNSQSQPKVSTEPKNKINLLKERKKEAKLGGGLERQKAQLNKGKKLARERLELLFDNGDFQEIDPFVKHYSNDFGLDKTRKDRKASCRERV